MFAFVRVALVISLHSNETLRHYFLPFVPLAQINLCTENLILRYSEQILYPYSYRFVFKIIFIYWYVCMYVCVPNVCGYPLMLRAAVTDGCELPNIVVENRNSDPLVGQHIFFIMNLLSSTTG